MCAAQWFDYFATIFTAVFDPSGAHSALAAASAHPWGQGMRGVVCCDRVLWTCCGRAVAVPWPCCNRAVTAAAGPTLVGSRCARHRSWLCRLGRSPASSLRQHSACCTPLRPVRQLRHRFRPSPHAFFSGRPPHARRVMCSTECTMVTNADISFQFRFVPNSRRQARPGPGPGPRRRSRSFAPFCW